MDIVLCVLEYCRVLYSTVLLVGIGYGRWSEEGAGGEWVVRVSY